MELQIKKYSANIRNTKQNLIGFIFPAIKGNETYYNIIVNELTMPNSIYRGVFIVDKDTVILDCNYMGYQKGAMEPGWGTFVISKLS